MSAPDPEGVQRFGAALAAVDARANWDLIAESVCDGDAAGFFNDERREAILDAGLKLASDLGEVLAPGGRSLYIGAAVAELAPILFESLVLRREVLWFTLAGPEAKELQRVLSATSKAVDAPLPRPRTERWRGAELGPCDHVWMTSVLTDPDAFPALHNELYGRRGTPEAVRGGHPKEERRRARALVSEALDAAAREAWLTTTDEELAFWEAGIESTDRTLEAPRTGRTSGLVGDVVRVCRLRGRG